MIEVVAAMIRAGERVLVCHRPEGKNQAGKWKFPGGKIEPGETGGSSGGTPARPSPRRCTPLRIPSGSSRTCRSRRGRAPREWCVSRTPRRTIARTQKSSYAAVARVPAEADVVAKRPSRLLRLVIAAEARARRHADRAVELDAVLHEHVDHARGEQPAHRAALHHQSALHAKHLHKHSLLFRYFSTILLRFPSRGRRFRGWRMDMAQKDSLRATIYRNAPPQPETSSQLSPNSGRISPSAWIPRPR